MSSGNQHYLSGNALYVLNDEGGKDPSLFLNWVQLQLYRSLARRPGTKRDERVEEERRVQKSFQERGGSLGFD